MSVTNRDFPLYPHEVTKEFLSRCLGGQVKTFNVDNSMTAAGVLADAFRVMDIEYESGHTGPLSCFLKCTKEIPEIVEMCLSTGVYAKEVYFYSTLIDKVKDVIRVPNCYGIFKNESDDECKEFCLVLEDFDESAWEPFEQIEKPMNYEDMINFMRDLGHFHSACWGEPVSAKPGLGPFRAHWQSLNDNYWSDDGLTTWDQVLPKWEEVYGQPLLAMVEPSVAETIKKIAKIYKSDQARQIQDALITEMQTRPRTITHGDARGNNIFKSKGDGSMGVIDWQLWVAGPASNEFGQVWLNSFTLESGMVHRLEELTHIYYQSLISNRPEIAKQYPFDVLLDDLKLLFVNIWIEYLGFTFGSIDGYRDPNQQQAKDNFKELIKRAMETLHYSGCLVSFQAFIDRINR